MFRETDTDIQMSLFDNPADLMGKRAAKKYDDPKAWFNQFFALVTSQVDESVFKPLFREGNMGAPTASIRRLVAMSVLKEGFGCSDEDLVEKLDYDLLSRKALGLIRIDSKLIGSNIAWYPRYELIHKTFIQEIGQYMSRLNPSLRKRVQP